MYECKKSQAPCNNFHLAIQIFGLIFSLVNFSLVDNEKKIQKSLFLKVIAQF
jgi:hypothetical protein